MSDSIRMMSHSGTKYRRQQKKRGRRIGRILLLATLFILGWGLWVTRDTHSMAEVIPFDQTYNVYLRNVLEKRETVTDSDVWQLLPSRYNVSEISAMGTFEAGAPDWIINNLLHDVCHISGKDIHEFDDVLFATRMSRIGTLIEYVYDWFSPATRDYAGGLDMRMLPDGVGYYAVRGRILLVSRSRDALINALTLKTDQAIGLEAFNKAIQEMGAEDIHAHFDFDDSTVLGSYFDNVRIALMIEPKSAWLGCRITINEQTQRQFAPLLNGLQPVRLYEPPHGAVSLALNFNKPVADTWTALYDALDNGDSDAPHPLSIFDTWFENDADEDALSFRHLISTLFEHVRNDLSLTLVRIDNFEMFPVPEIVAMADCNAVLIQSLLEAVPESHPAIDTTTSWPRRDSEAGLVYIPMLGGPALEPTLGILNNKLLFSTSNTLAREMLSSPIANSLPISSPANIFLKMHPDILVNDIFETGLLLAQVGAIKGYTEPEYRQAGEYYVSVASSIEDVAALISHNAGDIHLDIKLTMVD